MYNLKTLLQDNIFKYLQYVQLKLVQVETFYEFKRFSH